MKFTFYFFLISFLTVACNNSGEKSSPTKEPKKETISEDASLEERTKAEIVQETIEANLHPIDNEAARIATAIMAAPKVSRAEATVLGFNDAGEFVTLKEGTNELICLADDPKKQGFSAACYHRDLEPFMARGRELKAQNKSAKEIFDIRESEVKSGKLKMAKAGATLHIYYSDEVQYNPDNSKVLGASYRYVVYIPFATSASTGLPEIPNAASDPWIMNPGSHKAHIMISPSM